MTINIELTGKQFKNLVNAVDAAVAYVENILDIDDADNEFEGKEAFENDLAAFKELQRELTGE